MATLLSVMKLIIILRKIKDPHQILYMEKLFIRVASHNTGTSGHLTREPGIE